MSGRMLMLTVRTLLLAAAAAMASCNTMEGAGKDISAAGDAISGSASEHNPSKN